MGKEKRKRKAKMAERKRLKRIQAYLASGECGYHVLASLKFIKAMMNNPRLKEEYSKYKNKVDARN